MSLKGKLKLALVFITIMGASFIPGYFPEFFGDWVCKGGGKCSHLRCFYNSPPTLHYGFRHWIFILMGITFTIISLTEISEKEKKS
jgi:hypothetical protein